jgi:hypothetical protein
MLRLRLDVDEFARLCAGEVVTVMWRDQSGAQRPCLAIEVEIAPEALAHQPNTQYSERRKACQQR